ncbi:RHS repeat domain-containing protein [Sphingomonas sp. CFBP 13720]|uniref:RHS repeat domain-containing protein n=1 Tax=Sphingomonas sp. CFBP 13720 TaxID=2775302 RepID=UPI00177B3738|nr:RHS repeat domain-containing protein [Sphingomonas sp. CFBP 13720]MBD8679367.1 RHS repeat protein [Sphingomonas sp. CFBP 13720]
MVAIFTGAGTGFERGSGNVLGGAGLLGQAGIGRSGEQVMLNAANGNVLIMQQDELLLGRGPDAAVSRTYNSQGDLSDENGDNWRQSTDRRIFGLTGTVNSVGSTVRRTSADGSVVTYRYDGTAYETTDGAGAHDVVAYTTTAGWTWTDGDTQVVETYGYDYRGQSYITEQRDPSGNALTFVYADGKLSELRTANGERIQYGWSGDAITEIRTFTAQAGGERMQTRTRYGYDALGRLAWATVDLTPEDNSIADGRTYGSAYTYIGDTRLIASVAQTDGTRVDFEYDVHRRVTAVTQTVDASTTRVTRLEYGTGHTIVTDPAGQATRLDFAAGDFAVPGQAWGSANLTEQVASINGATATRYTVQTAGVSSHAMQSFAVDAGETVGFGISLQAVGDITSHELGLYSDQSGWGATGSSTARIVSGPGTIEMLGGGRWRVVGLSTTEGTRVEITRTYERAGTGTAFFYVDAAGGNRAGASLIAGGETLVRSGSASSLDRMDATKWTGGNLTRTVDSPIDGAPAYRFAVKTAGSAANVQRSFSAKAGETYSFLITLKAVGGTRAHHLGVGGASSSWGADTLSTARILSGPGAVVQQAGGFYAVSGLSTTEATTIVVTRTFTRDESAYARLFVALPYNEPAGASVVVSGLNIVGPVDEPATSQMLTKITAPAAVAGAMRQVTQFAYNANGDLVSVTDDAGGTVAMTYDSSGNLLTTTDRLGNVLTRSYDARNQLLRTVGRAVSADAEASVAAVNVYDASGRLRYAISAEGRVTRNQYGPAGQLLRTDAFTGKFWTGTGTPTEATMNDWVAQLTDRSAAMIVRYEYDARGEVTRIMRDGALDANGQPVATQGYSETVLIRDPSGRLLERVTAGQREIFVYDGLGRMIGSTDVRGATTSFAFDDPGQKTIVTLASGAVRTSTYNRAGELVASSEAGQHSGTGSASYRYDRLGQVRIVTDAFGWSRYVVYDLIGRKVGEVDPQGRLIEYRYDRNDRLIASIGWSNALSSSQMALLGDPQVDVDIAAIRPGAGANDSWNWTVHDREGRVVQQIDATGATIVYDYDAAGRLLKETSYANRLTIDALKATPPVAVTRPVADADRDVVTRTFYDRDGNVTGVLDGEGYLSRSRYDAAGNRIETTSFARRTTATLRASGSLNRLLTDVGTSTTDRTVRYAYDGQGLLRYSVDTVNRVTEYLYSGPVAGDATGVVRQTVAYAHPLASLATYSVATIRQELDRAGATGDPANRRGFVVHDDRGNLTFAIDPAGSVTGYAYDVSGNVVRTTRYATAYATTVLPTHDGMTGWAAMAIGSADDRVTRSYYAARGELRFTVDPLGYVTRYDYDAAGRNVAVVRFDTAMVGADDATTIDGVAGWQTGSSVVTTMRYDEAGRVLETHDAAGTITRYVYNVDGTVQSTLAAHGTEEQVRTQFDYDAAGRVVSRTDDADGIRSVTQYEYDGFGNLLTQVAPDGTSRTSYTYDREGRMLTRTDAMGQVQSYAYDSFGQRVCIVDERGRATFTYYDAAGRIAAVRDAENYVTETTYTPFGEIATVTRRANVATNAALAGTPPAVTADAKDAVTSFVYDKLGRTVRIVDAQGYLEATRYNSFGEVAQATNKLGALTTRRYDRRGQVIAETVAKSVSNAAGDRIVAPISIGTLDTVYYASVHPDLAYKAGDDTWLYSHWANYGWRERRNPNAVFDTGFYLSTYSDIAAANVDPLNHYAIWGAGEARSPSAQIVGGALEAGGTTTRYEYDARGNRTRLIEAADLPEQRVTEYSYDVLDRLVEKRGSDVLFGLPGSREWTKPTEAYLYDRHGNLTRHTDANGQNSFYYYDALGRKAVEVDATGAYVTYTYDVNGALAATLAYATRLDVTTLDPAILPPASGEYRKTSYISDAIGRRVSSSIADIRTGAWDGSVYTQSIGTLTERIGYDAAGNIVRTTDATGTSVLSYYEGLGRKIAQVDQENYLTEWTLDAEGNVLTERRYAVAVAGASETARPAGVANDADRVTRFTYDRNGRRLTETREGVIAWTVDPATGALVAATGDATITYAYNGLGLVTSKTEATGDTVLYTYDRVGRLVEEQRPDLISNADDEAIPRVAYFYDGVDNLVRVVEGYDRVTTNRYDAMGRKTATVDAMGSERSFHYDRAGNLIGEAYSRRNSAGTLLREGVTYRYDAVGRLRYQNLAIWTAQNGVATNWVNVGDYADITYNAFGEVASRAVNGKVQERHDYDAAGRVWRSTGGDGVSRYFVHDGAGRQTLVLESDGGVDLQNRTLGDVLTLAAVNGTLAGGPETGIVATISQYDRRGQAIATRSPRRELNGGASGVTDLLTTRSYTAFGEVASETDARGASIHYAYNRMGRVVAITRPTVVVVGEDGQSVLRAPVEERYYDISGRLVGARDANGNLSTRILAAGTGYEGAAELVTGEYHADGGRVWLRYDDAGNLVRRNDELNRATLMEYDKLGRLLTTSNLNARDVAHSYTYDSLGRRLTHSQTGRGADDIEKTDYDIGGRVVSTRAFGGDVTTTSYSWDSSITSELGAAGGWRQTTTYANGKTTVEYKDTFGRMTRRTDMGGNSATTSFDQAGRVARITGLEEQTFVWFNTGQLASQTSDMGTGEVRSAATFGYEPGGNIVAETFTRDGVLYRNTTAAFDLQGRMTSWAEVGNGSVPAASTQWLYDANGNIRSTASKRSLLDQQGAVIASGSSETAWFRYDSMSRMTLDGGQMVAGVLQRANGTEITYRVDGSRATSTSSVYLTGTAYFWEPTPGQDPLMPVLTGPDEGGYQAHTVSYLGERRETYSWRDDGQLQSVAVADTGYIDNGDGTLTSTGDFTRSGGSATYDYDALGRQTRQVDRNEAGSAVYDRQVAYDTGGRGLIASETVVTIQQGGGTVTTSTTNDYGVGADYALGAVRQATVGSTVRSGGTTTTTSTTTTNSYQWRDGAVLLRSVTSKAGSPTAYRTMAIAAWASWRRCRSAARVRAR